MDEKLVEKPDIIHLAIGRAEPFFPEGKLTGNRIWMSGEETDAPLAELLSNAGVREVGERLVTETTVLTPENRWKQAVLTF